MKNKSHSVTAQVEVRDGANGVVIAQGGAFAGWSLYVNNGVLTYCYNLLGLARVKVAADSALDAGQRELRMDFHYDGGGLAKGGDVVLSVDGSKVGTGRLDATVPLVFSGDETTDVGCDYGTSVSDDYTPETSRFSGTVRWVVLEVGEDDHDHLITPEDRLRVAMARQ
jgi:arylsulfatase